LSNRIRPLDEKVKAILVALGQINIAEVARQTGVPESTLRYDLNKVVTALPDVLKNHKPGPKPQVSQKGPSGRIAPNDRRPTACPHCHSQHLWKNGTYLVLNWLDMLLVGWCGVQWRRLQRWRCADCQREIPAPERAQQAQARQAWWQQVKRVLGLSRFKLALSTRKTQLLLRFLYARQVSLGFIQRQTVVLGSKAQTALERLNQCRQAVARFLLYDETFPKLGRRAYSLGVAICEHGLIRSVRCLRQKAKEIPAQLRATVQRHFHPEFFLSDLDVSYDKYLRRAGLSLTHLRDLVHLLRQVMRLFDEAVRDVTLDVPKKLPIADRKKQRDLKRRLLRQQLQPILEIAIRAFSPGYESVCVLMLYGAVSYLQDPRRVIQTASVLTLAKRLQRFAKKHEKSINCLLELAIQEGTPKTINGLESKNGIFKPFSVIAKFFPKVATCQVFFAGVALMENFDTKTRGIHQGSSAMQRAGINLEDFGAADFFAAVGLVKPQISLPVLTG
jgi:DNA-binding transcriptional MerR regulator